MFFFFEIAVPFRLIPSWEVCLQAIEKARVSVSNGNESKAMAIVYCGYNKP